MATIMAAVKRIPYYFPHGTAPRGWQGVLRDKLERYGASAAFGFSKTYFGEKFIWGGHGADAWIGGLGLLVAAGMHAHGSKWAHDIERLADAAVSSAVGSLAASYGLEKAGHHVTLTPAAKPTAMPAARVQGVIGAVPAAKSGPYLTPDMIANFAQRR